jgi:hypothetical protein
VSSIQGSNDLNLEESPTTKTSQMVADSLDHITLISSGSLADWNAVGELGAFREECRS